MTAESQLLKQYSLIETEDGSQTLYSEAFGEACHSTSGARAETHLHYLQGCQVENKAKDKTLQILEVGFGTGLGFEMTVELLSKGHLPHHFTSLEIDPNLIKHFFSLHPAIKHTWQKFDAYELVSGDWNNVHFMILIGNARTALSDFLKNTFVQWDAIYQDAFSPKRNPVLWSKEWFELLRSSSAKDVILSTYSASNSIRKSLHEAGWSIQNGEKFGPKRSSTRARLEGETPAEILDAMKRSPAKTILDADLPKELFT